MKKIILLIIVSLSAFLMQCQYAKKAMRDLDDWASKGESSYSSSPEIKSSSSSKTETYSSSSSETQKKRKEAK